MNACPISGCGKIIRVNKPQNHRGRNGGNGEEFMKSFFIIKGKIPFSEGMICHLAGDAGMPVGKFFVLPGFGRRLFIFRDGEQIFPAVLFKIGIAKPQAVDKVKVRAKRRQGVRCTANFLIFC